MWLEQLASRETASDIYPLPFLESQLDFRPLLTQVIADRLRGRPASEIARAFHRGIAFGIATAARELSENQNTSVVVLSGGVFQNELLLSDLKILLSDSNLEVWTNHAVPANDGGISLGQAALAVFANENVSLRDFESGVALSPAQMATRNC
jgi:hydrogenase maturation protein HypF